MKKNIIALAIASAVAAPVAFADAPTVYGKVNMAIDSTDVEAANSTVDADSGTQVNSRASRVGIKGSEDLGNGLKAIYKLEFEVQIDKADTLKTVTNMLV
jgi:predicted porin